MSEQDGDTKTATPRLRFPEFKGTRRWRSTKIGDLLEKIERPIEMSDAETYSLVTVKRRYGGVVAREQLAGRAIKVKSQFNVRANDFLISKRQIVHDACGIVPPDLDGAIVSNEYSVLRARENCDIRFFDYFAHQPRVSDSFLASSVGIVIEKMLFKLGTWFRHAFPFPDLAEQQKIADCLTSLDEVIAAQGRKVEALKAHKRGLMQQLFPREGEAVPRLRFPEFRDGPAWETKRVSERGDVLAGKALAVDAPGALRPYLRTKNVLDGAIDLEDMLKMPMTDAEFGRFEILVGDILLNEGQSLELVGRASIYRGEFGDRCAMQNQLLRFRAFPSTCPKFAAQLFRQCQKDGTFASIATKTTSVAHLGSSRFAALELTWPASLAEQQRIGEFLDSLDDQAKFGMEKLAALKAHKQGLMQRLFPAAGS